MDSSGKLLRKWQRVLKHLAEGHELTRFDAEQLGDHALNTTISVLSKKGLVITRRPLTLRGRFGDIHCLAYSLELEQRQRALEILARRT